MTRAARAALALLFAGLVSTSAWSCSAPGKGELQVSISSRASPGSFRTAGVGVVFEKRCGTLDCHGSEGRNLRIYSSDGLRLPNDAGLRPGTGATSLEESTANYQSLVTLEPEAMNRVLEGGDPYQLLILKKPLEIEKHKGGPAMRRGDDAELCIVSWLKEDPVTPINKDACTRAAVFPKE